MNYYVGIDIGGTYIKYGLVSESGELLKKDQIKTSISGERIIESIEDIVSDYQKEVEVTAVGISVPGIVEEDGYLTTAGAIHDLYGVQLKGILEEQLLLPVAVENDAVSSALAEKWLGAGQNYSNFFTVVIGTGVGGAIIIDDKVIRGAHSTTGEFGFMIVNRILNNDTRASTLSLNGSVQYGLVDNYYKQQANKYSLDELNGELIYKLAHQGDELAQEVIEQFYQKLATGLFNVLTLLDPEVILVGGGISANQEFIHEINKKVDALKNNHVDMINMKLAEIKACRFLNDAGIYGSVYKAIVDYKRLFRIGE